MKYHAFISYSHRDKTWADWLHKGIETYRVPRYLVGRETPSGSKVASRIFPVFRDRDELPTSTNLHDALLDALHDSQCLIVICSPASAKSHWVNEEVREFKRMGRADRVLAIVVDGTPNATYSGHPDLECFPEALRYDVDTNGQLSSRRVEPIAADVRPQQGDGRTNALLKLIAGILGVAYDDLRQREAARRRRRLALFASVSGLLTCAFAILAIVAWFQRNEAVAQRERAVTARKQAESILNYLVTDLRKELVPLGRQDISDQVKARVDDYYRELAIDPTDSDQLQRRAIALTNAGEDWLAKREYQKAFDNIGAALKIRRTLVQRIPDHSGRQRELATTLDQYGRLQLQQGEAAGAATSFDEALVIRRRLSANEPESALWQSELADTLDELGEFRRSQSDLPRALDFLEESLRIRRTLAQHDPRSETWQVNLARTLTKIALAHHDQNRTHSSREDYAEAISNLQTLNQRDPDNFAVQALLVETLEAASRARMAEGDMGGSTQLLDRVLPLRQQLVEHDKLNLNLRAGLALNLLLLGERKLEATDNPGASPLLEQATELYRSLATSNPENAEWALGLGQALYRVADTRLAAKDVAGAIQAIDECTRVRRKLAGTHPDLTKAQYDLIMILLKGANWVGSGTRANAVTKLARLREALALCRRMQAAGTLPREDASAIEAITSGISQIRQQWNLPAAAEDGPLPAGTGA